MTIHKFIHNKKNQRVGVILAAPISDTDAGVGWSLCHRSKGDKFDKTLAVQIATDRVQHGTKLSVPSSLKKHYDEMVVRANKYFKGHKITA